MAINIYWALEHGPELDAACAAAREDPTDEALTDILRRAFGHEAFKPGQLGVIRRVLGRGLHSSTSLLNLSRFCH